MNNDKNNRQLLMKYAGLGFQLIAGLGLAVWFGHWLDQKWEIGFPVCTFALPLVVIIAVLVQVVKDTGAKK